MKKIFLLLLMTVLLETISYSQYDYGLDVCGKDAKIEGRLNLDAGNNNIFIGLNAGLHNQGGNPNFFDGTRNTFVGYSSGQLNTIGRFNTFIGDNSGANNQQGSFSTFVGTLAGNNNLANSNSFFGYSSGQNNVSGTANTFIGGASGTNNEDGNYNTFLGQDSGRKNKNGSNNVYLGLGAAYQCESGSSNVFVGYEAGWSNLSGSDNTYIGNHSGSNASGSGNVFIGNNSGSNSFFNNINNTLIIDNSDTIAPLIVGNFVGNDIAINGKLHVLQYLRLAPSSQPLYPSKGIIYYDASDDHVKVWNGIAWQNLFFTSTETETSFKEKTASPCTTSCIEVAEENANLKKRVDKLEAAAAKYGEMKTEMEELKNLMSQLTQIPITHSKVIQLNTEARLEQNAPNPFNGKTKINYFLPNNIEIARLKIFNASGQMLKDIQLDGFGEGFVEVQVDQFVTGIYHYSLEVDGQIIDTKKMSILKN